MVRVVVPQQVGCVGCSVETDKNWFDMTASDHPEAKARMARGVSLHYIIDEPGLLEGRHKPTYFFR